MNAPPDGSSMNETGAGASRPQANARWVCGHQRIGLACTEGPLADGTCSRAKATCSAGTCDAAAGSQHDGSGCQLRTPKSAVDCGPGPCVPLRTAWFSRQTIAINSAILVGGLLLMCMAIPQREVIFAPGALSSKHAQILENRLVSERCSLCHPAAHAVASRTLTQDELCMKCHDSHLPDAALRSPHDLNKEQLSLLNEHALGGNRMISTGGALTSSGDFTSSPIVSRCASCHMEHHGTTRDLREISDARCQACHRSRFASLADGHPEFEGYPYRVPRRIAFDHFAHQNKHFAQKDAQFECSACHVMRSRDAHVGPVLRTLGFEEACASCHAEPIQASVASGWAVLQVPSIEPDDLQTPSQGLSGWPSGAQYGYDGQVSVALRLLLSTDPDAAPALSELPISGKLSDISPIDEKRRDATRRIAKAVRRLIADVAQGGQSAWKHRLVAAGEGILQRALREHEHQLIDQMSAGVPPDLFRKIEQDWFQDDSSLAELKHKPPEPVYLVSDAESSVLEAAAAPKANEDSAADELLDEDDELLTSDSAGELLGGDLLDGDLLDGGLLGGNDSLEGAALSQTGQTAWTPLRGATHVAQGGWYLDQDVLALRYMPRGHADPTLAAWVEFVELLREAQEAWAPAASARHGSAPVSGDNASGGMLPGNEIPGSCTQCHVLAAGPLRQDAPMREPWSKWKSVTRPESIRLFTKFDHTPHLTLTSINDCRHCHVLNGEQTSSLNAAWTTQLAGEGLGSVGRWHDSVSQFLHDEFVPMKLSQCVACHRSGGAEDGCTQCHNYHVGTEGFDWSQNARRFP